MSPVPAARDRRQLLLAPGATLNGIDYVEVASPARLSVHFLNTVTVKGSLSGSRPVTITGGEVVPSVAVSPIDETTDWSADSQGRPVLALTVTGSRDFSAYRLAISSGRLDPFFDQAPFSFAAHGPAALDTAAPAPAARRRRWSRCQSITSRRISAASSRRCRSSPPSAIRRGWSGRRQTSASC